MVNESCAGMMERASSVDGLFSLFVAQALGYMRNGIIKISFILVYIISLFEKG